jgi:hypothetical protein
VLELKLRHPSAQDTEYSKSHSVENELGGKPKGRVRRENEGVKMDPAHTNGTLHN